LAASATSRVDIGGNFITANNLSNTSTNDGVCVAAAVFGLDVHNNIISNTDASGLTGHQKYAVGFTQPVGAYHNIDINNNDCSGNDTGCIRYLAANGLPVTTQSGNTNDTNPIDSWFPGSIGAYSPGTLASWLVGSYGSGSGNRAGVTDNCKTSGAGWYCQSDSTHNGGWALIGVGDGTGGLYIVPTNGTPTLDQTVSDATLTSDYGMTWDASRNFTFKSAITLGGALTVGGIITAGSSVLPITTAAGKLDAAQLTAGTGVAPYPALGTGGTGSGHYLSDAGTWLLTNFANLYDHSGTAHAPWHVVVDTCTLGTSCSVTLAGSAVFTGATTYTVVVEDATSAATTSVTKSSGSAFAITGTGTDVLWYIAVGY
jgi:hypothetical protein